MATEHLPANRWAASLRQRVSSQLEKHSESVNHPETVQLIASVEEVSGFRVTIDTVDGIQDSAQMISARPGYPFHLIRVNSAQRRYADYIVAVQCGMLLLMWSDPTKVPELVADQPKCDYRGKRWSGSKQMASMPREIANKELLPEEEDCRRCSNSQSQRHRCDDKQASSAPFVSATAVSPSRFLSS